MRMVLQNGQTLWEEKEKYIFFFDLIIVGIHMFIYFFQKKNPSALLCSNQCTICPCL